MALLSIPQDLNETYEAILSRTAAGDHQCVARTTLLWLSFVMRHLIIDALNQTVMIHEIDNSTDQSTILLDIYCGLIQYDPVTSEVTLAHSSVKAFLTSKWTHSSTVA